MNKEYYSCEFIEGGLVFTVDKLALCCITNHGRGCLVVCDYHGEALPVDRILAFRDDVRRQNQEKNHHPLCDRCGYLVKKEWEKKDHPFMQITIAHFTQCNLRCNYCYVVKDGFHENPTAPYDLYPILQSLIRDKLLSPEARVLWGGGEPTIHKDFEKSFRLLLEHGVFQEVPTNATVLSPVLKEGLQNRRASLTCSLDAGTAETFQAIKGKNLFHRVLQNLEEYAGTGGQVSVKIIVTKENCHEVASFLDAVERATIRDIVYEVDFHDLEQPDEVIDAIARLIYECSIKRGLNVYESTGGIASFGEEIRARINKRLDEMVVWEEFLEKQKYLERVLRALEILETSKPIRFTQALRRRPLLMYVAETCYSFLEKAHRFLKGHS